MVQKLIEIALRTTFVVLLLAAAMLPTVSIYALVIL